MTQTEWVRLDTWAGELYAEHHAYWDGPYEVLTRDYAKFASQLGFLPCPNCPFVVGVHVRPFGMVSLELPGWNGKLPMPFQPCESHERFFRNWFNSNRKDRLYYPLLVATWNEQRMKLLS